MSVSPNTKRGLMHFLLDQHHQPLARRVAGFNDFLSQLKRAEHYAYHRLVQSPMDRAVTIADPYSGQPKQMLMFASNNYLGLANHPRVKAAVQEAVAQYGAGVGGPPLLNGYSELMHKLETELAAFKGTEAAMVFPAGFMTNVGVVSALARSEDVVIHDQLSHASLHAGLKLADTQDVRFPHNDVRRLRQLIREYRPKCRTVFVAVEGVYSMDGDTAPLDKIVQVCREEGAFLLLDDAHGMGVLGPNGTGTAAHYGVEDEVDLYIGTFSKVFAVTGGYLAGRRDVIEYLRFFARPYLFSAALPPSTLAAVRAGLEVIQEEPERRARLHANVAYAKERLRPFGLIHDPEAAILALRPPKGASMRHLNRELHERGMFVNAIEYPAVKVNQQRFRISICASHRQADIDALAQAFDSVWAATGSLTV